jgi:hypothetical protein
LARLDRKRKKRMSNEEWKSPSEGDARITKMQDGRTHLAHKAEHAVDMDTGAVVAVTLQGADQGDTTTLDTTLSEAGMAVAEQIGARNSESVDARAFTSTYTAAPEARDGGYISTDTTLSPAKTVPVVYSLDRPWQPSTISSSATPGPMATARNR